MSTVKFPGYHKDEHLPIKPGQTVTIRKGVEVKTVGKDPKPAGKTYRVKVHHLLSGISEPMYKPEDPSADRFGYVFVPKMNPMVVWAGPGGYWSQADVNLIPEATINPEEIET